MITNLSRIVIVLYQPQDLVNVASIIRVMSNFGINSLRLIEPAAFDPYRIEGIAHGTQQLVAATRSFKSLDTALADCTRIYGTSGRHRSGIRRVLSPRLAAPLALQAGTGLTAILFGTEQDGLPNSALDRCHAMITIPTHADNSSLNLAQAALVIAYELWQAGGGQVIQAPSEQAATGAEQEELFGAVAGLMQRLYPGSPADRMSTALSRLRNLLLRAVPTKAEALALGNLLRHAARAISSGRRSN